MCAVKQALIFSKEWPFFINIGFESRKIYDQIVAFYLTKIRINGRRHLCAAAGPPNDI